MCKYAFSISCRYITQEFILSHQRKWRYKVLHIRNVIQRVKSCRDVAEQHYLVVLQISFGSGYY